MLGWIASICAPRPTPVGDAVVHVSAGIGRALEVHAPRARTLGRLGAAGGDDRSVCEPHRLVLDRTEDAVRQPSRVGPRPPAVARRSHHAPPALRTRADLVEQRQRLVAAPRTTPGSSTGAACHPAARRSRLRRRRPFAALTRRDSQMPTSAAPSRVPPNHAATSPSFVSTIVEACALANGAVSNTNSEPATPRATESSVPFVSRAAAGRIADRPATAFGPMLLM